MKKKDKEAFLRSITGTKPIQKKNNIKKSILEDFAMDLHYTSKRKKTGKFEIQFNCSVTALILVNKSTIINRFCWLF